MRNLQNQPQTYYNWKNQKQQTGNLNPKKHGPRKRKINNQKLKQHLKEHPDAYLKEIAKQFNTSTPAICKKLKKLKITRKKNHSPIAKNPRKKTNLFRALIQNSRSKPCLC
ncbi:MAG: transposase [Nitrososphaerota archaeon]|nr:transposase [Nitrososphaerota archaeon]